MWSFRSVNKIYWMAIKNYVDNILPIIEPLLTSWQLPPRECVSTGAAGALTYSSLGHHFLHPLILRRLVLCAPADFEAQSSLLLYRLHQDLLNEEGTTFSEFYC